MDIDPQDQGYLSGRIYAQMMAYLDSDDPNVNPQDVMMWWSFWERVCPKPVRSERLFWLSLVVSLRCEGDPARSERLFKELSAWLTGDVDPYVHVVHLPDDRSDN